MLEKIKNNVEKIPEQNATLMAIWLKSIVVFGLILATAAIAYYCPYGPLIVLYVQLVIICKDILN